MIRFEPALNVPQTILDEALNRIEDVFKTIEVPKPRAKPMYLYAGEVLHVNLTTREIQSKPIKEEWLKDYVGGWGLATRYYYDLVDPKVDPLSADNALVFMTGPLVRYRCSDRFASLPGLQVAPYRHNFRVQYRRRDRSRAQVCRAMTASSSPARRIGPSICASRTTKSVSRTPAPIWGRGIFETEEWLDENLGHGVKSLSIGPAGENLVPFSLVGSEAYRSLGRGGAGALFGSKNLKAIACRGTGGVQVADMGIFLGKVGEHQQSNLMSDDNLWARTDGTPMLVNLTNEMGIHPTRNFTSGVNPERRALNSEAVKEFKIGDRSCASCPLGCGNFTSVNGVQVEGPEYETLCIAGSNCAMNDMEQVMRFNRECDDLGLDTISTGATIALAMELTESDVHNFDVHFGKANGYLEVLPEIAYLTSERGRDLALGAAKMAAKYGAEDQAAHSKGLEMPAYDPRGNYGMGLAYATSERGACHLRAFPLFAQDPFKLKDLAREVIDGQNVNAVKWSMCFCDFWGTVDTKIMADLLTAGLGRQVSAEDLDKVGERIWNLNRLFNVRAGFTANDDFLPKKLTKERLKGGPHDGRVLSEENLAEMRSLYYHFRGWDGEGRPQERKLRELRLESLV